MINILRTDEHGQRFGFEEREGRLVFRCDTAGIDNQAGTRIDVPLSRGDVTRVRDELTRWLAGDGLTPPSTLAVDVIEQAGFRIEHVTSAYDRVRQGTEHTFYELINTCATLSDGTIDPIGMANIAYLSRIWGEEPCFAFAGCVQFRHDAQAPEGLIAVVTRLREHRPIEPESFMATCALLGIDPATVEYD